MNSSSATTAASSTASIEEEGRFVSFIICALRSGIPKEELFSYLIRNKNQMDLVVRDKCFLRALEINERISKQVPGVVPIGLITEFVRIEFGGGRHARQGVVRGVHLRINASTELILPTLGETVRVVEESPDSVWLYVQSASGGEGWVPARCIDCS